MNVLFQFVVLLCAIDPPAPPMCRLGHAVLNAAHADERLTGRFLYLFVAEGMLADKVQAIFSDESPEYIPMDEGKVIMLWFDYGVYVHIGVNGRVCGKFLFQSGD